MKEGYSIRTVAQLTGLSIHVIRAWERRYDVVEPERTEGNQRSYSEEDVLRLRLLARAVEAGHSIGRVAALSDDELEQLLQDSAAISSEDADAESLVKEALAAVRRLDSPALEDTIVRAAVALGQTGAIELVVEPLMDEIGRAWHEGELRIMHEHLASAVVRNFLGNALRASRTPADAVGVVVAAPSGQLHELGALSCAVAAAAAGLRVTYLGADVPAEEILAAVFRTGSAAVILSVVFPASPGRVRDEFAVLQKHLQPRVRLIAGGASASLVAQDDRMRTMSDLRSELSVLTSAPTA